MSKSNRKTQSTPRLPESGATRQDRGIVIIKTASCSSRSGRSELCYQLGKDDGDRLHIKIAGNSGNGHFNEEWLNIDAIHNRLAMHQTSLTASLISNLFEGKSVNTGHFVFAALLSEGFLIKDDQNSRHYRLGNVEGFMSRTQILAKGEVASPMTIMKTVNGSNAVNLKAKTSSKAKPETVIGGFVSESEIHSDDESLLDILLQSA